MDDDDGYSTPGNLVFLKRLARYDQEKPYHIAVPAWAVPEGKHTNEEDDVVQHTIHDLRPCQNQLHLDRNGFEVIKCPPVMDYKDFEDRGIVQTVYLPKTTALVKRKLGAIGIWVYDWKIRRRSAQFPAHSRGGDAATLQPAPGVHVDFVPDTLLQCIESRMGEEMLTKLGSGRVQAINFWRPLFGPLQDWPLALCDFTTFDTADLIPCDHVYPHKVEETYSVFSNPGQRWYFLKDQNVDEAFLFKTYDSEEGVARCAPHASFAWQDSPPDARLRESIEIRFFVTY